MNKLDKAIEILKKYNHEYLLNNYSNLDNTKKEILINQILNIDFEKQNVLFKSVEDKKSFNNEEINQTETINLDNLIEEKKLEYEDLGKELIKNGKLAIVTLAGGQGTRLGHKGPKGTYMLLPNKSLFEILCDKLKDAKQKYNTTIAWYIMTSKENNRETIKFFEDNNYFNYSKKDILFFNQNDLPMNLVEGDIILNEEGLIKCASDGHGGIFKAMQQNGILDDINKRNIDWVLVSPIDNPLIELVDPIFMGVAEREKLNAIGKSIIKKDPNQKSGVFCLKNNKVNVLEYTEINPELANKKDDEGNLFLSNAHINCNMFNIKTIEEIVNIDIPYHIAKKKATYIDRDGNVIVPEKPNAYKYEKFIFDYFPYIEKFGIYTVKRELEYEPVKDNAEKSRIAFLNKKGVL